MSIVERALAKASGRAPGAAAGASTSPGTLSRRLVRGTPSADAPSETSGRTVDVSARALLAAGLAVPHDFEQRIGEELRVIKRPLLKNAEAGSQVPNGNVLMVGSALPGAGKTFMSMNLALSMASELDWNVLLVDADISRPTLSRGLGLGDARGLLDLLEDERGALADYIINTSHAGLQFLPAGAHAARGKELLGSQRMAALLADLVASNPRQIILFDSSPLLLTSESRVLASYVGQIVLVVEAGRSPRQSVLDAIELLDPTKAINLVLNKSRSLFGRDEYHYASYGYGYGRETEKKNEG